MPAPYAETPLFLPSEALYWSNTTNLRLSGMNSKHLFININLIVIIVAVFVVVFIIVIIIIRLVINLIIIIALFFNYIRNSKRVAQPTHCDF